MSSSVRFTGSADFRCRLVSSTLSGRPLVISGIRERDESPGLGEAEAALLRLVEKISNGCGIEVNETGTALRYKPGIITGGSNLSHDCGTSRAISWFLEPLLILSLFGKKPLAITLRGVTNDDVDPHVDVIRTATLPLVRKLVGVEEGLELKVVKRGAKPGGGGEVHFKCPVVRELKPIQWTDEGMVKRVRGVAFTARVSPHMAARMVDAARGVLNRLLPDVYIFTDTSTGAESGNSPGFGISLVAETTTGCLLSADCARGEEGSGVGREPEEGNEAGAPMLPEDIGTVAAQRLLCEIQAGGCADSAHQSLVLMLCALGPEELARVRLGTLTPQAIRTLRIIHQMLGVRFHFEPEPVSGTVFASCVGSGHRNLAKKLA
eukprot:jgi/Chlat1/4232/Chrsp27S08882